CPSQKLYQVDRPTCIDLMGVAPVMLAVFDIVWSSEMWFASATPSCMRTMPGSMHVSHAPGCRPWLGSTLDPPSALNEDPFSRPEMTIILLLKAARGSSTPESCHAAPTPAVGGFHVSEAPLGR